MKKLFFSILFSVISFGLFAAGEVSPECEKLLEDFFQLRMELSVYDTVNESDIARNKIDEFEKSHAEIFATLSDDEKLTVENFYVNEHYNFLYMNPKYKDLCRDLLKNQFLKNEAFCKNKSDEELNKWLLVTYGDVTSCSMAFSMKDVMKYGLSIKPLYERAIAMDPDFFYSNLNLGQWYFWAPGVAGGSNKKAVQFSKKAVDTAQTDAQKYFSYLLYSQLLFESKDKNGAAAALEECRKLCPDSKVVQIVAEQNSKGKSLFEYNREKSGLSD